MSVLNRIFVQLFAVQAAGARAVLLFAFRALNAATILLLAFLATHASAEIINADLPKRSFGFGLATLYVEQPDQSSEQRYRWDFQEFERLPYSLRLHNRLGIGRDTRPRSDAIEVHQHIYEWATSLQWTATKLFRYAVGAGPLLLLEQTITRVDVPETTQRTNNRGQLGWLAEAQLDYAFNDVWELALNLGFQFRPAVNKDDFSFGVSLQFNTGIVRKDDIPKPKIP